MAEVVSESASGGKVIESLVDDATDNFMNDLSEGLSKAKAEESQPAAAESASPAEPAPADADDKATASPAEPSESAAKVDAQVAPTLPPGLQKLAEQYGGNLEMVVARYHEVMRQNAEFASKQKELERPKAEPEPTPIGVVQLEQRLSELKAGVNNAKALAEGVLNQWQDAVTKHRTLDGEISDLIEQISNPDPDADLSKLGRELTSKKRSRDRERQRAETLEQQAGIIKNNWQTTQWQLDQQQVLLDSAKLEQVREKSAQVQEVSYERNLYNNAVETVAKAMIPEKRRDRFNKLVKSAASDWLNGVDESGDYRTIDNWQAFAEGVAKEYLTDLQEYEREKMAAYSQAKKADATVSAPSGKQAVAKPDKRAPMSAREWDDHLEGVDLFAQR